MQLEIAIDEIYKDIYLTMVSLQFKGIYIYVELTTAVIIGCGFMIEGLDTNNSVENSVFEFIIDNTDLVIYMKDRNCTYTFINKKI